MHPFLKFFPLVKVDEAAHMAYGLVTAEIPDKENEICDYEAAKKAYQSWSEECLKSTTSAGQEPSLGNIRVMHQLQIGGKAVRIDFDDAGKKIFIGAEPANDGIWQLIKGGFIRGFSQGGDYLWKKPEGEYVRYAPTIGEVSFVDNPALKNATFSYVKADGSMEMRKFSEPKELTALQLDTRLQEIHTRIEALVGKLTAGSEPMTPEELKKPQEAFELAKSHLSALHSHLAKAIAGHDKMSDHVSAKGADMHKAVSEHLKGGMECCMKAMGADEAAKAALAVEPELKKIREAVVVPEPEKKDAPNLEGYVKTVDVEGLIERAIDAALDKATKGAEGKEPKLFVVNRGDDEPKPFAKAASAVATSAIPV